MQQTRRFQTEEFKNGISVSRTNIDSEFKLSENSVNITYGNYEGIGPRYGLSPVPGQCSVRENAGNSGLFYNVYSIPSAAKAYAASCLLFFKMNVGKYDDYKTKQDIFAFVTLNTPDPASLPNSTANIYIDINVCCTMESVATSVGVFENPSKTPTTINIYQPRNYIDANVDHTVDAVATEYRRVKFQRRASIASFAVGGREYPQPYIVASNMIADTATNPGVLSFYGHGEWQECATGPSVVGPQGVAVYSIQISTAGPASWAIKRIYENTGLTLTSSSYVWSRSRQTLTNNFTPGDFGGSTLRTGTFTGNAPNLLYYNPNNKISSGYTFIGVAAGKAIISFVKDDQKSANSGALSPNGLAQYIDLENLPFFKQSRRTLSEAFGTYTEDTEVKRTVFSIWPIFVTGTPLANDSAAPPAAFHQNVRLGDANTGMLRSNTVYEITYSVFNKALNFETNVGVPAKVQTGTNDFVRLSIFRNFLTGSQRPVAFDINPVNNVFSGGTSIDQINNSFFFHTNHLSLRFYYRALGTFEWLPTLEIDACDFFFNPERLKLWICENPVARAPGGQPGGFNDYSPILRSDYHTVLQYQGRAFWISNSVLCFSMQNNPLAYPIRNSIQSPKGRFLGALEHAYPGQAEQDSRIVVFGTEGTYAGRFVPGAEETQFVRVGPFDGGEFPVEGTNFRLRSWTSVTAFSGRAAAVAKGILYYWGPQGVYMDDGRDLPVKISGDLEPWLNGIYDKSEQENIFAIFNDDTEDLIWFFKPPAADQNATPSQALVLNVRTMAFNRWTFKSSIIHSAQKIDCRFNRSNNTELSGERIMVFCQQTGSNTNRTLPQFLDANNYGGDHAPNPQYVVYDVATSGLNRVLSVTPNPPAGSGVLSIVGYERYADKAAGAGVDGFYAYTASGGATITITPTAGVNFPTTETLNNRLQFPIYLTGGTLATPTTGPNSIDMTLQSQFWAPSGLYSWWLYLYAHFLFRVKLLKTESSNKVTVTYQGMIDNGAAIANTLTLSDNSRENCQILNSIAPLQNQVSGQGMKLTMTCVHIGGIWSLQYLGMDAVPQNIDEIMTFEG